MQAETPVCRHVNCPLLLWELLVFDFWCLLHVSKLWVHLQEDGCTNRYGIVCCTCIRQESVFHTQVSTYKNAYGWSWAIFTEITELRGGRGEKGAFRTLCYVTSSNPDNGQYIWYRSRCHVSACPNFSLLLCFFSFSYSISLSFVLLTPLYDTPPRPMAAPTDLGNVYLLLHFILMVTGRRCLHKLTLSHNLLTTYLTYQETDMV